MIVSLYAGQFWLCSVQSARRFQATIEEKDVVDRQIKELMDECVLSYLFLPAQTES